MTAMDGFTRADQPDSILSAMYYFVVVVKRANAAPTAVWTMPASAPAKSRPVRPLRVIF